MDFSEVIAELRLLNSTIEPMNRGQLDIIAIGDATNQKLDALAKAISEGNDFNVQNARNEAAEKRGTFTNKDDTKKDTASNMEGGIISEFLLGIGQVGAALGAAALAFTAVWPRISNTYEDTIGEINESVNSFLMSIVGFSGFLTAKFTLTTAALTSIGKFIKTTFVSNRIWKRLRVTFRSVSGTIRGWATTIMKPFRQIGNMFGPRGPLGGAIRTIRGLFRPITGIAARLLSFFPLIRTFVIITETLGGAFTALERGGDWIDAIRGALEGFANGFVTVFRGMGELLGNVTEFVLGFFLPEETAQGIGDSIRGITNGIANVASTIITFVGNIAEGIARFFGNLVSNPVDTLTESLSGIMDSIGSGIIGAIMGIRDWAMAWLADTIRGWASIVERVPGTGSIVGWLRDMANGFSERGVMDLASSTVSNMGSALSDIGDATSGVWTGETNQRMVDEDHARDRSRRDGSVPITGERTAQSSESIDTRPMERASVKVAVAPSISSSTVENNDNRRTTIAAATPARDFVYAMQANGLR